ncbi:polyamine-modulated factor 1 [Pholidichthys leucotaenia]
MEEKEETTQEESVNNGCADHTSEDQARESTGEPSSQRGQPTEEKEARLGRLKLFNRVMQQALNMYIKDVSFNRFAGVFRPLYKKNPLRMERIHKQFIEELRKSVEEDINRLIEEGQLEVKLNELDKLESAAKNDPERAWRPSGVPEQDLCSFLFPYYQKQEAFMKRELKEIQAENAALAQKVQAGRERITQTELRITTAVNEWKASVTEFERLASCLCPADVFDV